MMANSVIRRTVLHARIRMPETQRMVVVFSNLRNQFDERRISSDGFVKRGNTFESKTSALKNKLQNRLQKLRKDSHTKVSAVVDFSEEIEAAPLDRLRNERFNQFGMKSESPETEKVEKVKKIEPVLKSFADLGLSSELLAAVEDLELTKPTEIQALGVPAVLSGKSSVLASHTGSGKTLAYLMPVVQLLREEEIRDGYVTKPKKPRVIVLCPTRELAEQVLQVGKSICHHARFRSAMISGGGPMKPQQESLQSALDIIVGTPGRLLMHQKEGNLSLNEVKYLILDEADTMFDRGFGPEVRRLLTPIRKRCAEKGDTFQTVLVTATITKAVRRLLDEEFPGIEHIRTATLHKRVASAKHDFIQVKGDENKMETLKQILQPSLRKCHRVMVFCNTVKSCRAVDHIVTDSGISTANYHGEVPAEERVENLEKFRGGYASSGKDDLDYFEDSRDGPSPILVCTDLAARGLDLTVDQVVMFDFPNNPIDYLHRTGRTARMGAKGKITSLVTKHDYFLAHQIEEAIAKGESLDALTKDRGKVEKMKQREVDERKKSKELQARKEGRPWQSNRRVEGKSETRGGFTKGVSRGRTTSQFGGRSRDEVKSEARGGFAKRGSGRPSNVRGRTTSRFGGGSREEGKSEGRGGFARRGSGRSSMMRGRTTSQTYGRSRDEGQSETRGGFAKRGLGRPSVFRGRTGQTAGRSRDR